MNATITLFIYWSIAAGLIGGGLFALAKGFQLVLDGKGKAKEQNSIELLGLKANLGSVGAMVMLTAFMWGWAAKLALPTYKGPDEEISALTRQLQETEIALATLKLESANKLDQAPGSREELSAAKSVLGESRVAIAAAVNDREETTKKLTERIAAQQTAFKELQAAVKADDPSNIQESAVSFKDSTIEVKAAIQKLEQML